MPRTPEFDADVVMSAALETFWARGYNRSSMQILLDATGLNRGSLYNSFGDKEALFRSCLDLYFERMTSIVIALLDQNPHPVEGIRSAFEMSLISLPKAMRENGCLLVNTVAELSETDPKLARHALTLLHNVREAFARALERAAKAGLWDRRGADPRLTADLLFNYMNGLRVTTRLRIDPARTRGGVLQTLQLLGLKLGEASA